MRKKQSNLCITQSRNALTFVKVLKRYTRTVVHQNIQKDEVRFSSGIIGSTLTSTHGLIYQRAQSPRDTTRYLFSF